MTWDNTLCTCGCILSQPEDLRMSSLPRYSLTWSYPTTGISSLLLLALGPRIPGSCLSSKDWGKDGMQYPSLFHVLCNQVPHLIEQWDHILTSPPFVTYVLKTALLLIFDIPGQRELHLGFSFLNYVTGFLNSVLVFLLTYPFLLPASLCCFFCVWVWPESTCSSARTSWHFCLTSYIFGVDHS